MFYIERYPEIVPPIIIFLLAYFVAHNGTWLMKKLCLWMGALDHPGEDRHDEEKREIEVDRYPQEREWQAVSVPKHVS